MDSDYFDVVGKLPAGAMRDQVPAMLRTLLQESLKLAVHRENKEQRVYFLVAGKNGSRLRSSTPPPDSDVQQVRGDHPPIQLLPGALTGRAVPISAVASSLALPVGYTVVDHTGLRGFFDIKLTWTPENRQGEGPDIFTAIQEQMGLRLEPGKAIVETLVIDHAEREPVEN
jgi:uncharacterized protein (TIGR03435 family)